MPFFFLLYLSKISKYEYRHIREHIRTCNENNLNWGCSESLSIFCSSIKMVDRNQLFELKQPLVMDSEQSRINDTSPPLNPPIPLTRINPDANQNECYDASSKGQTEKSRRDPEFPTAKLLISGIFVVLGGGFNFGFQLGVINPMAEPLQQFVAKSLERRHDIHFSELSIRVFWSSIAGILFIGAVVGATIMPAIASKIGSRWSFVLIGILMIIGVLCSPVSQYIDVAELFILSRFAVGICAGMGMTLQGVFLTEISPIGCRGLMGMLSGLSTNIGVLLASAVGLPQIFGTAVLWPYAYYVEMIPCLMFVLHATFILRESPLYFLERKDESSARKSVEFYHRNEEGNPEQEIRKLRTQLQAPDQNKHVGWIKLCADRATRRALGFAVLLNVAVSFSGIVTMSFFGTSMLAAIGFTQRGAALANCLASLSGTAGLLVGAVTIDNIGRRFLLIGSLISLVLGNIGMMALVWTFREYRFLWLGYGYLLLFVVFIFVFSVGIGPLALFISTELADPDCRAQVQSLAISTQYITCFLCPILYSPLENLAGELSFLLFIIPLTFTTVYIYCCMPETRNRSPEEIRCLLEAGKRQP